MVWEVDIRVVEWMRCSGSLRWFDSSYVMKMYGNKFHECMTSVKECGIRRLPVKWIKREYDH